MDEEVSHLPGEPLLRLYTPYAREKGLTRWRPQTGTIEYRVLADLLVQRDRYRDHLPIGPRGLAYLLLPQWVGPGHRYETKEQLRKTVTDTLTKARRAGIIDFEDIDDQRTSFDGPVTPAALANLVAGLQINRQAGQPYRVEVWVETKGNVTRLANICIPYGVSVYSGSGSVPISANRATALRIIRSEQPTLLLVLGDFDPAGLKSIAGALHDDVLAFVRDLGGDPHRVQIRHLGITTAMAAQQPEAVREYFPNPPWDWPLIVRGPKGEPLGVKVELEALPPDQLDALVEDALSLVRDEVRYATAMAAEPNGRVAALEALALKLRNTP